MINNFDAVLCNVYVILIFFQVDIIIRKIVVGNSSCIKTYFYIKNKSVSKIR